jgi:hypothetical protein
MLQGHLALRGNAYNRIVANRRGEIVELMPIHPDRIRMELTPSGDYRYRVTDRLGVESDSAAGRDLASAWAVVGRSDGHEPDRPGARESGHGAGGAGLRCALLRQRRETDRRLDRVSGVVQGQRGQEGVSRVVPGGAVRSQPRQGAGAGKRHEVPRGRGDQPGRAVSRTAEVPDHRHRAACSACRRT